MADQRPPSIMALFDGRPGNDAQTEGVADALDLPYRRVPVAFASRLDRLFDAGNGAYLSNACRDLLHEAPAPDIIISAGGRAAYAARYVARHIARGAFRVNIMTPSLWFFKPDMCVIPMHDTGFFFAKNAFYTVGAPNNIAARAPKDDEIAAFLKEIGAKKSDSLCGICIGGAVKGKKPSKADVSLFIAELKYLLENADAKPLVSFSRRTPAMFAQAVREALPAAYFSDNIRMIYAASKILCVTGDSINMCSEACSAGKPAYIALLPSVMRKKHLAFTERLATQGYARLLADRAPVEDDDNPPKILADASAAAKEILRRYAARNGR